MSGVYKLIHIPSNKFYIGSSKNIKARFFTHISHLKKNTASFNLQQLWNNNKDEWTFEVLELCSVDDLDVRETHYINQYIHNVNCLNTRTKGFSTTRGIVKTTKTRHRHVKSMIGKNTTDKQAHRDESVTFISPEGKVYRNVKSINMFAQTYNLSQPLLNQVANKQIDTYKGWTIENGELPNVGNIERYWPIERIKQHYPEYHVIGPDGQSYITYNLRRFEEEHNCKVVRKLPDSGVKKQTSGLDEYGRGYRLIDVPTFTVHYNNKAYRNVVSLSMLAQTLQISYIRFVEFLKKPPVYKRKFSVTIENNTTIY